MNTVRIFVSFILFFLISNCSYSQYHWERLPGLYGGHIQDISMDVAGNLFAETRDNLYRSSDKGETWIRLEKPKKLNGMSWESIDHFFSTGDKIYYTAAMFGIDNANYKNYVSTDNGKFWFSYDDIPDTWFHIWTDLRNRIVYLWNWEKSVKVEMKTGITSSICDNTIEEPKLMQFLKGGKILLFKEKFNQYKKKTETFLKLFDPENCIEDDVKFDKGYISSICVAGSEDIFVALKDGIYQSSDLGKTWNKSYPIENYARRLSSSPDGKVYFINPSNDHQSKRTNIKIIGKQQPEPEIIKPKQVRKYDVINYTEDNGKIWKELFTPFKKIESIISSDDNVLYTITDQGLAKYADSSWKIINNGITELKVNCISFDKEDNLYAGTTENGILKFNSDSSEWETFYYDSINYKPSIALRENDDTRQITGFPTGGAHRIHSIYHGEKNKVLISASRGISTSNDNGISWELLPFPSYLHSISKVVMDSKNNIYALGQDSLFVTKVDGMNWKFISPKKDSVFVTDMSVDSKGRIFISTTNDRVNSSKQKTSTYISKNMGKSWNLLNPILRKSTSFKNIVNDNANILLYSSRYGQTFAYASSALFLFIPDSSSWLQLGEDNEHSLKHLLKTKDGKLLRDNIYHLSISDDDLKPKTILYKGLDNARINDLAENSLGEVFAATDNGVYILRKDNIKPIPYDSIKSDTMIIIPNQVKYDGEILFKLEDKGYVLITFTDRNGNDYYLSPLNDYTKGIIRVEFNVSSLEPGTYTCKLATGKKTISTQKFEVIR